MTREPLDPDKIFEYAEDIYNRLPEDVPWVVKPYVAEGAITEVVGRAKAAGKTTFLMRLVRAVADGAEFLGHPTEQSHVVYLTEEADTTLKEAFRRAGIQHTVKQISVLQARQVLRVPWEIIHQAAVTRMVDTGAKLLIIDTLSPFTLSLGLNENNADSAIQVLNPIRAMACAFNYAVIIVRHEKKAGGDVVSAGRGSSAYAGSMDIMMQIRRKGRGPTTRTITAMSRFSDTPSELIIELTDEGYQVADRNSVRSKYDAVVECITRLESATVSEVVNNTGLARKSVQDSMDELVATGKLARRGRGVRCEPFLYSLVAAAA